jgi:hypothetical protein
MYIKNCCNNVAIYWGNNLCQVANIGVKIFSNIKYIIFPLLFLIVALMFRLFIKYFNYFHQYFTDKPDYNKYFCHQWRDIIAQELPNNGKMIMNIKILAIRWRFIGGNNAEIFSNNQV